MNPVNHQQDVEKLKRKLRRVRLASLTAIELGDCHAVAWLTCQRARLEDAISLAEKMAW